MIPTYILGLDLGKATDHTALILAEPSAADPPVFDITHIERIELHTRYTRVVEHVCQEIVPELRKPVAFDEPGINSHGRIIEISTVQRKPQVTLLIDHTGVGTAVAEMFIDADPDCDLILVTITAGTKVIQDEEGIHIPKGELVSAVQRVLQEERLRYAADDPQAELLAKELTDFKAKIGTTGHVSYAAAEDWRSGAHDDLVLAASMALWFGESGPKVWVG